MTLDPTNPELRALAARAQSSTSEESSRRLDWRFAPHTTRPQRHSFLLVALTPAGPARRRQIREARQRRLGRLVDRLYLGMMPSLKRTRASHIAQQQARR